MARVAFVIALVAGCAEENEPSDGGDEASGGSGASAGSGASGGTVTGGSGGAGGTGQRTCLPGVAGIWAARNFPAYLEIDSGCVVTLFCDVENDYHTTGYVDDDLLVLSDLAVKLITVAGDVLTVLDAEPGIDLPFDRQSSPAAIPDACRL
jgi:hypothetical protein